MEFSVGENAATCQGPGGELSRCLVPSDGLVLELGHLFAQENRSLHLYILQLDSDPAEMM